MLCYGGDGTFLAAERQFPGVPKLLIRYSKIGHKCEPHLLEEGLELLQAGRFRVESIPKLHAAIGGTVMHAVNDIVVRNVLPTHAVRFRLSVDGTPFGGELIGDGIVLATPFGADAYFRSITKRTFVRGLGLALNNVCGEIDHLILNDDARLEVTMTRGEAVLAADNDPHFAIVAPFQTVLIERSPDSARLIRLEETKTGSRVPDRPLVRQTFGSQPRR